MTQQLVLVLVLVQEPLLGRGRGLEQVEQQLQAQA